MKKGKKGGTLTKKGTGIRFSAFCCKFSAESGEKCMNSRQFYVGKTVPIDGIEKVEVRKGSGITSLSGTRYLNHGTEERKTRKANRRRGIKRIKGRRELERGREEGGSRTEMKVHKAKITSLFRKRAL